MYELSLRIAKYNLVFTSAEVVFFIFALRSKGVEEGRILRILVFLCLRIQGVEEFF
jgi:hypothetical protein